MIDETPHPTVFDSGEILVHGSCDALKKISVLPQAGNRIGHHLRGRLIESETIR